MAVRRLIMRPFNLLAWPLASIPAII